MVFSIRFSLARATRKLPIFKSYIIRHPPNNMESRVLPFLMSKPEYSFAKWFRDACLHKKVFRLLNTREMIAKAILLCWIKISTNKRRHNEGCENIYVFPFFIVILSLLQVRTTRWVVCRHKRSKYHCLGLLPDAYHCRLLMRRECQERFPRHRLQRKPLVSDPDMQHGTCVTHAPWGM